MRKLQVKPSKFLLNPVRALNFLGGWEELEREGGWLVSFFTIIFVLLVCIN